MKLFPHANKASWIWNLNIIYIVNQWYEMKSGFRTTVYVHSELVVVPRVKLCYFPQSRQQHHDLPVAITFHRPLFQHTCSCISGLRHMTADYAGTSKAHQREWLRWGERKVRQEMRLSQKRLKEAATGRACFERMIITQLQEYTDWQACGPIIAQ